MACQGGGTIKKRHRLPVSLPPGVADGERIVRQGQGHYVPGSGSDDEDGGGGGGTGDGAEGRGGGRFGDVIFVVSVSRHPVLQRIAQPGNHHRS